MTAHDTTHAHCTPEVTQHSPRAARPAQSAHSPHSAPPSAIADELGRVRTLASGPGAYMRLWDGEGPLIILEPGPRPTDLAPLLDAGRNVMYVASPPFVAAMGSAWRASVPAHWAEITPDDVPRLAPAATVWYYRLAPRLFNAFWGPVIAAAQAARLDVQPRPMGPPAGHLPSWPTPQFTRPGTQITHASPPHTSSRPDAQPERIVLLPGTEHSLLIHELSTALQAHQLHPLCIDPATLAGSLPRLLREARPCCALCVNGQGLDREGTVFHLLCACGVPVVIWIVDNPWHVLSAWPHPWWREATLFVTDAAFIPALKAHGAQQVVHLPLGAWMPKATPFADGEAYGSMGGQPPLRPVVFVGRSAFPDKQVFFSGLHLPPALCADAAALLDTDAPRPDFDWWMHHLKLGTESLWPGRAGRQAGLGAENASALRRAVWLRAAQSVGLTVFGDSGWASLLGTTPDIRPPVDYYTTLPRLYATARYSLNITSLLLPSGLTQRHFDVWSAGGFLLTDATPGLDIFPDALTAPIRITRPADLPAVVARFEKNPSLRHDLRHAWADCLHRKHNLTERMRIILQTIDRVDETP